MPEPKSAQLFFREGSSDKVYEASLHEVDGAWQVDFRYGRRGKPLKTGTKIAGADHSKAEKVYEKLISDKISKGYTPSESGQAFTNSVHSDRVTGFRPQLFNEISDEGARNLGPDWLVQEKHDGERRGVIWDGSNAIFSNRRGLQVDVDQRIASAIADLGAKVGAPLELDAEDMGETLVIFDVLKHFMIQDGTFRERAAILAHLEKTIGNCNLSDVLRVDVPTPADAFFDRFADKLQEGGAEGYVIRHADSINTPGRPASGGDALKVKYWAEATCRVAPGRDGKSSIGLELQDGIEGPWIPVGNVTVPANKAMPAPGDLVEVRYLYAMPGGSLFQPVLKGPRTDVGPEAAQMVKLKFKRETERAVDATLEDGPSI